MGNHLKRQAGVAEASYKGGTLVIKSEPARAFQIGSLLRVIKDELGFAPIKRVDATVRGRLLTVGSRFMLEVAGTDERLAAEPGGASSDREQTLTGTIQMTRDGHIIFKPSSAP